MSTCNHCGAELEMAATGRPRRWCDDRCRRAAATAPPPDRPRPGGGDPGPIERSVRQLINKLAYLPDDPRFVTGLLAVQVAAAVDHRPATPSLTRELRAMLNDLTSYPNEPAGAVDELRVMFLKRRVEYMLGAGDVNGDVHVDEGR